MLLEQLLLNASFYVDSTLALTPEENENLLRTYFLYTLRHKASGDIQKALTYLNGLLFAGSQFHDWLRITDLKKLRKTWVPNTRVLMEAGTNDRVLSNKWKPPHPFLALQTSANPTPPASLQFHQPTQLRPKISEYGNGFINPSQSIA